MTNKLRDARKLTEDEVLAGLRQAWLAACDDPSRIAPIGADDNIIDRYRDEITDSLGEVSLYCEITSRFGTEVGDLELRRWFEGEADDPFGEQWEQKVKPTLTFGALAHWIAARSSVPSFAPLNVAGRSCGPAGVFLGIAETVDQLAPGERFPPRTPILSRLRGKDLERIWNRLHIYAHGKLPPLVYPYKNVGDATLLAGILIGFIMLMALPLMGIWGAAAIAACAGLGYGGVKLACAGDPLPENLKTFRDISYALSAIMNGPEPTKTRLLRDIA